MSEDHSSKSLRPSKPYPEYPLYAHKTGRWAKKIRGKTHFFGPWRDPHGALRRYLTEKDDLEAGRPPPGPAGVTTDALTVKQMVCLFLASMKLRVQAGDMESRTWREYESYGKRMCRVFGEGAVVERLGPDDFRRLRADLQKTHKSLASIRGDIRKIKVFFNWAGPGTNGQGYIDRLPRFGDGMKPPSAAALERERNEQGDRVYTAEQVKALLASAGLKLKAMILLGVNCGYGNTDCAKLDVRRLDLTRGWVNFARPKTGIARRCPLWPETIAALREVLKHRPTPGEAGLEKRVFITHRGKAFRGTDITHEFEKLAEKVGMTREGADFYDLRRTCASIGVQVKDDDAVRTILGHKRPASDMLGTYNRLQVGDGRLLAVTDHIHAWLFKESATQQPQEGCAAQLAVLSEPAA